MAKSLRSKWKRKMRAVKRVRYGEKEKIRLLNMLEMAKKSQEERELEKSKSQMEHEPQPLGATESDGKDVETMESDAKVEKHSAKTLKNDSGSYPVWLSNRKIQKLKTKNKVKKNPEGKVNKRHKKKYL